MTMSIWHFTKRFIGLIVAFVICLLGIILIYAAIGVVECPLSVNPVVPGVSPVTTTIVKENQQKIDQYYRPMASTYLTFPEWYIVYSSREYANFLKTNKPSGFPYFASIEQYWCGYHTVYQLTKNYPFNMDNHVMLIVIGISFSAEYVVKGLYENSIGRLTEWLSFDEMVDEDKYAQKVAQEYVDFIPLRPWFEFPFSKSLSGLWHETSWYGPHMIRKWERKLILSAEYSIKTVYGWLIGLGSHAALGAASDYVYATIHSTSEQALNVAGVKRINHFAKDQYIIAIPHEQPFTDSVNLLSKSNSTFIDIAGNHDIFLTIITPKNWQYNLKPGTVIFIMNILTDSSAQRIALLVPVSSLLAIVNQLNQKGVLLEHIYDY